MLPSPPRPPLARTHRWSFSRKSASTSPLSTSFTTVPGGTLSSSSGAAWPFWSRPRPGSPLRARYSRLKRKSRSVVSRSSVKRMMSPPFPPSPPEGPPRGAYFSRRNATAPGPPSPALTWISASSMNCMGDQRASRRARSKTRDTAGTASVGGQRGRPGRPPLRLRARLRRQDVHVRAVVGLLPVLHLPLDHGVDGEVAAHPHGAAGMHPGADLPHEDVARHDALAAEYLDAAPLPRRIAPVARRPLSLLVCHLLSAFAFRRRSMRPRLRDPGDLQLGVGLAVPADAVPTLFLGAEVPELAVLAVRDHFRLHLRATHRRRADLDAVALAESQHLERHLRAHRLLQLLYLEEIAFLDAVLLSARADHCVHRTAPWLFRLLEPARQAGKSRRLARKRARDLSRAPAICQGERLPGIFV